MIEKEISHILSLVSSKNYIQAYKLSLPLYKKHSPNIEAVKVHFSSYDKIAGFIEFEKARVRWFLSIDNNDLPNWVRKKGDRTFRSIIFNKEEIEFSKGFEDLHTLSYKEIIRGSGFEIEENRNAIEIIEEIRNSQITGLTGDFHPYLKDIKI